MSGSVELENCKREIRSMLIPYQRGCSLRQLNKDFYELIGKRLPARAREFGFSTDIEFLYSMPDVVKISPARGGDYLLQGIADEKSKHIQNMVMRQKPTKSKGPPLRLIETSRCKSRYLLPPRFSEPRNTEKWNSPVVFRHPPSKVIPKAPPIVAPKEPLLPPPKVVPKESLLPPPKIVPKDNCPPQQKSGPEQEVISLVQNFNNKLALDDLLVEYKRMYNKNLSLSLYGFSSIKDCVDSIPELGIVQKNKVSFVVYHSKLQNKSDVEDENPAKPLDYEILDNCSNTTPTLKGPPGFHVREIGNQKCDNGNVPKSLRNKFQEVAKRFPDGMWACDFLRYFEEETSESLDLHDLGYSCLNDLIDDVPDIFIRKPVAGSRKDYVIYPADELKLDRNRNSIASLPLVGPSLVDHIVFNLKNILEAYPEGIKISEILHIYSINCKDSFHVEDLGFDDLDTFLSSIKGRVPFKFDFINGEKSVHLLKLYDGPTDIFEGACKKEAEIYIPFDAAPPDFHYKPLTLPADFDDAKFFPVYTSAVANPGHLYIQFQEDINTQPFKKMSQAMEKFYHGNQSELFMMKSIHITEGRSCVAKWPSDNHWYRAQILSISSLETVAVYYVDYGTKDVIPKTLLRYANKEFIDIPIQALKCRLAYLKKPNNAVKWDIKARDLILSLCQDVPLMARIEEKMPDGIYSIILCDTNDEEDLYINDVLCNEKLAEYDIVDSSKNNPVTPEKVQMEYQPLLNPLQALQAQYFLKAFAAVAPIFAQEEHYLALVTQVSTYCQNIDPVQQNVGMPTMTPPGPPGFNGFTPNMNTMAASNVLLNTNLTGVAISEDTKLKTSIVSSIVSKTDNFIQSPFERESSTLTKSIDVSRMGDFECENEIFDEDDDEMFHQFCQKLSTAKVRYIKKVPLSDGFKIHTIVVREKPYASSGDISQLIWNNKEADYLLKRLQLKEVDIPSIILTKGDNEELFLQLEKYNVKGVQNTNGKPSILLYPLNSVIKILNLFGHPSATLRKCLIEEIANFNPNNKNWQNSSPEASSSDEDTFSAVTDDDKIERLCLHDLLAMKESIHCKRKKMSSSSAGNSNFSSDEAFKLEQLNKKVLQRIKEIKEICRIYS